MIARTWKAQALPNAEPDYLETVRSLVLPNLRAIPGYRGAQFLRRPREGKIEILVVTYWDSMEALQTLTDGDPTLAYVPQEVAAVLDRFDVSASNYELMIDDDPGADA